MQKAGNNKFLKDYNRKNILNIIRLNKNISKIEIANITGLSPTAAGKIVSSLIEDGLILENFEGESNGGRKPMMLCLNDKSYYSMGIDIESLNIKFVLINLSGEKIFEKIIKNYPDNKFSVLKDILNVNIKEIIKSQKIEGKLLGIGISIPALININKEIILAPNLALENIAEADFQMPSCYIVNEAKASAIYESFMGACINDKNFICLNIGSGIGAGIYIDGKLYVGSGGMAGEVGHIQVEENGRKCGCGNYGCLETVASSESIKNGDKKSEELIGGTLAYLVNIFNPSKIVLGKDFSQFGGNIISDIKGIVQKKIVKSFGNELKIVISENGGDSSVQGAALIPLKKLMGL